MDGLSLAASVITIIQLTGTCLKLSKKWLGPSEFGSADLATVERNLYGFIGAMKAFQTHLEIHEDDQARLNSLGHLLPAVKGCEDALTIVQDFIKNRGFIRKHLAGPKFDGKLKASLKALEEAKKLFELSLQADHQVILLGVERYIRNLTEDFQDFQDGITASLKLLHENGDKTYMEIKKGKNEQDEWQKATSETTLSIQAIVHRQDIRGDHKDIQAILEWLTPLDYAPQHNDFIKRRQVGTGQWFLDSSEFQTWVQGYKKTLFCPGMPGSGKTILASIVIDELTTRFADNKDIGIAYIYFNFRRKDDQKTDNLFAGLLKQLAQRILLPESVKSLHNECKETRTRPSLDKILRTLQSVADMYSRVFIIVDALDECQTSDGCRKEFLSELLDFQAECGVNLFVTSRFMGEVTEKFEGSISLEIRASEQDLRRYVAGHISRLPSFVGRNPDLQTEIQNQIVKAVDGMFLLAQLHLDSLMGKRSPKALKTALTKLRTGFDAYDHAYDDAMERIKGQVTDQEELAKQVLSWITHAKRPLMIVELQHALAVEVGDYQLEEENLSQIEDIVSVCAGLVTIDNESRIIRLVHYTTEEYFLRTHNRWFPNAQLDITRTCVTYLSFKAFKSGFCPTDDKFEERLHLNPLYDYAAQNWGHHARETWSLSEEIMGFLKGDANVEASSQALIAVKRYQWHTKYSQQVPREMTGLHLAAYFGVEKAAKALLVRHSPDFTDSSGQTPLSYAAANGHKDVVQLLLATGGVDVNCTDSYGGTPLSYAAANGHKDVVQLLLATSGVDVNCKDSYGGTPLLWAVKNGHETVIELLLAQTGIDTDCQATYPLNHRTPLSFAAGNGHEAVVKLLLATGRVDINSRAGPQRQNDPAALMYAERGYKPDGLTPLMYAARAGHEAVVKLLLARDDIDPETTSIEQGWTSLSFAAVGGHEKVVKLLLAYPNVDLNSNATTKNHFSDILNINTPLYLAAKNGHEAVVRLLLATYGVDVNFKDSYGRTALLAATESGHETVVRLLLATNRADVNSADLKGQTALLFASKNGQETVVRLLLATDGIDVNFTNLKGETALLLASGNGHEAVVRLLIATDGIDVNFTNLEGETALSWASVYGQEAAVRLLLATDRVDVNYKDSDGRTALSAATRNGHSTVVELILAKEDIDLHFSDRYGRTLILWAAQNGHDAVVKLLLSRGRADLDSKHESDQTLLWWAAANGHGAVVKLLLTRDCVDQDSGDEMSSLSLCGTAECEVFGRLLATIDDVNVNSMNNRGRTPLYWAAENGQEEVVNLLLQKGGVDPDRKDFYDETPLFAAARNGRDAIVKLLLAKGVKANSINRGWKTPLVLAAEGGHNAVGRTESDALLLATENRHGAVVKLLLDKGADIESKDICDQTPLLSAARRGHEAVVKLLLDKGADVESKYQNWTPLLWAARNGDEAVVKLLLDTSGIDANSKSNNGETPLLLAAESGHEAVVKALLESGKVNVDPIDDDGRTPLLWAIEEEEWGIVKLLRTDARSHAVQRPHIISARSLPSILRLIG
ncbi:hypothetical protein NUW58_g4110 [Xylaria curta]|uniref:Uncharacterized protein n=1 Tax=Xylaria curta TaxID=42375 RepID=A0ACC1PAW8_9PEZI|nr:hypothetical protein NUW58_g4110 [Xylaria curta]